MKFEVKFYFVTVGMSGKAVFHLSVRTPEMTETREHQDRLPYCTQKRIYIRFTINLNLPGHPPPTVHETNTIVVNKLITC